LSTTGEVQQQRGFVVDLRQRVFFCVQAGFLLFYQGFYAKDGFEIRGLGLLLSRSIELAFFFLVKLDFTITALRLKRG
jgi:ABC-type transporter Mla maintaining outer membrane lipid asymmetry permease subunit MlaE